MKKLLTIITRVVALSLLVSGVVNATNYQVISMRNDSSKNLTIEGMHGNKAEKTWTLEPGKQDNSVVYNIQWLGLAGGGSALNKNVVNQLKISYGNKVYSLRIGSADTGDNSMNSLWLTEIDASGKVQGFYRIQEEMAPLYQISIVANRFDELEVWIGGNKMFPPYNLATIFSKRGIRYVPGQE
jgi:hypothetical protein